MKSTFDDHLAKVKAQLPQPNELNPAQQEKRLAELEHQIYDALANRQEDEARAAKHEEIAVKAVQNVAVLTLRLGDYFNEAAELLKRKKSFLEWCRRFKVHRATIWRWRKLAASPDRKDLEGYIGNLMTQKQLGFWLLPKKAQTKPKADPDALNKLTYQFGKLVATRIPKKAQQRLADDEQFMDLIYRTAWKRNAELKAASAS